MKSSEFRQGFPYSAKDQDPRTGSYPLSRKNTTVGNQWVSSQLNMGHELNVSQAVWLIAAAKAGQRARLRNAVAKTLKSKD